MHRRSMGPSACTRSRRQRPVVSQKSHRGQGHGHRASSGFTCSDGASPSRRVTSGPIGPSRARYRPSLTIETEAVFGPLPRRPCPSSRSHHRALSAPHLALHPCARPPNPPPAAISRWPKRPAGRAANCLLAVTSVMRTGRALRCFCLRLARAPRPPRAVRISYFPGRCLTSGRGTAVCIVSPCPGRFPGLRLVALMSRFSGFCLVVPDLRPGKALLSSDGLLRPSSSRFSALSFRVPWSWGPAERPLFAPLLSPHYHRPLSP